VQFPVTVTAPVDALLTPKHPKSAPPFPPDPPTQLPEISKVPVEELTTPPLELMLPPVILPTMDAVAGDAAVNCRQLREVVVVLFVTKAVSVTPSFNV
jgi:hypothetical protein